MVFRSSRSFLYSSSVFSYHVLISSASVRSLPFPSFNLPLLAEMNRDHSVIFEIASKYCVSDSFVDYDGYSISSKGFLPTVVDIMVI